jgi:hypothetical protein
VNEEKREVEKGSKIGPDSCVWFQFFVIENKIKKD